VTFEELRAQLVLACKMRKWPVPSRKRLKKLRDAEQLPAAIKTYEKGKRGCVWRFPESTVAAYLRTEELRRASGKRVRSWKRAGQRERGAALRPWLAKPETPVPRDLIGDELQAFADLFRHVAPAVYPYVERPVVPAEDERLDGAHAAIESTLDAMGLPPEWRPTVEAMLQLLVFREESGNAEDVDLAELLEPIRQRAGPFSAISGVAGICRIVHDIPLNEVLTNPRGLLARVSDQELQESTRRITSIFDALERVAKVTSIVMNVVKKARSNEDVRGDPRLDWFKPMMDAAKALTSLLHSDFTPAILCACAVTNVWLARENPNLQAEANVMVGSIAGFANLVEQSSFAKNATLKP
jgi:hypothetical protein